MEILLQVHKLPPDSWDRPRLRNARTGRIYADINLGDRRYGPPAWHTTSHDGEPDAPLRSNIVFEIVGETEGRRSEPEKWR